MEFILSTILVLIAIFILRDIAIRYLNIRKDTYKDMDVLHSKELSEIQNHIRQIYENLNSLNNKKDITIDFEDLKKDFGDQLSFTREKISKHDESIKDLLAKSSIGNIVKAFTPQRKG